MTNQKKRSTLQPRGNACAVTVSAETMRHVMKIDAAVGHLLSAYCADQTGEPAAAAVQHWREHRNFAVLAAIEAKAGRALEVFTRRASR